MKEKEKWCKESIGSIETNCFSTVEAYNIGYITGFEKAKHELLQAITEQKIGTIVNKIIHLGDKKID